MPNNTFVFRPLSFLIGHGLLEEAAKNFSEQPTFLWLARDSGTFQGVLTIDYITQDNNEWKQNSIRFGLIKNDDGTVEWRALGENIPTNLVTNPDEAKQYLSEFNETVKQFDPRFDAGNQIIPIEAQATQNSYYLIKEQQIEIPENIKMVLSCPITGKMFEDPVFYNGNTYEKSALLKQNPNLQEGVDFFADHQIKQIVVNLRGGVSIEQIWEDFFLDPITRDIIMRPVVSPQGQIFDKGSIEDWLKRKQTNPVTNLPLTAASLQTHETFNTLKNAIINRAARKAETQKNYFNSNACDLIITNRPLTSENINNIRNHAYVIYKDTLYALSRGENGRVQQTQIFSDPHKMDELKNNLKKTNSGQLKSGITNISELQMKIIESYDVNQNARKSGALSRESAQSNGLRWQGSESQEMTKAIENRLQQQEM